MQSIEMQDETLKFPKGIITGCAGNFSSLYAEYTEAPEEFYFVSFLLFMGNLIADRLTMKSEISPQPRINALLLGASGELRKSSAVDATIKFYREAIEGFEVCGGVGSGEGLAKRLSENNKTVLFFDELKQLVSKCKIEGSVLLPTLTTLFEKNYYENNTKTSTVKIENAYLSVIACSTVKTFEGIWNSAMSDIGFTNRLLLIPGNTDKRIPIPKCIPQSEKDKIKKELASILKRIGDFKELDIEDEANEVYADWYNKMERSDYSRRLDTYAMRLMMLFAVNDGKDIIDSESVLKAICFCDWQLKVRKELTPIDADNAIARMEEKIRRQLSKRNMKRRELQQYTNANRVGSWSLETALNNLIKSGEIKYLKKAKVYTLLAENKPSNFVECSQKRSQ